MIKKTGYGSLSIVFFILAILSSTKIARTFCLGDEILNAIGISPWSGSGSMGFHRSIYITIVFLVLGLAVGRIFNRDWGAKKAWILSAIVLIFLLLIILLFTNIRTTS